jgi:hypothetical protein
MVDPRMFQQLSEVMHRDRVEQYARRYGHRVEQEMAPRPTVSRQVRGAWRALLARLSLATGH